MPATASLEHFNVMSTNTPDEFEPDSSPVPDEETQAAEPSTPQEEQATEEETPFTKDALPPEAQGETNGGPLGCCLGTAIGMLLSLSLAIFSRLYVAPLGALFHGNYGLLGLLVRILMGLLILVLAILFGYIGWKLGKRFYREYEPPVIKERKRRVKPEKIHQKA